MAKDMIDFYRSQVRYVAKRHPETNRQVENESELEYNIRRFLQHQRQVKESYENFQYHSKLY